MEIVIKYLYSGDLAKKICCWIGLLAVFQCFLGYFMHIWVFIMGSLNPEDPLNTYAHVIWHLLKLEVLLTRASVFTDKEGDLQALAELIKK